LFVPKRSGEIDESILLDMKPHRPKSVVITTPEKCGFIKRDKITNVMANFTRNSCNK
jgi:hypothetical protein